MGWTRKDLEDPNLKPQDKIDGERVIKNFMANDEWATKYLKKVGILLTSHPGNRGYLKASIESHKKLGYWIAVAYDNYINPEHETVDYNRIFPSKDVMDQIDTFLMPHHQTWGGVLYPYFWLLKLGVDVLSEFEYIYCANGDCILEKPENFGTLLELLGDYDIISCGPVKERSFNTAGMIAKTSALKKMMKHFQNHLIPFEEYEKHTQEIGNTEGRFARAIKDLGLKQFIVAPPVDEQMGTDLQGWWYENLGFRHIHAEHNKAYRYKGIPPHYKYMDPRFVGGEYNTIKEFWDSGCDKKILEKWWCKD